MKGFTLEEEIRNLPARQPSKEEMRTERSSSDQMSCGEARSQIADYMDGDLERASARRLLTHLDGCRECESIWKGLQNVVGLLGQLAEFDLPPELRNRPGSGGDQTGPSV